MISFRAWSSRVTWPSNWLILLAFMGVVAGVGLLSAYQAKYVLLFIAGAPLGLGLVIWPEMTLGLYANISLFKGDPRLSSLTGSIDITLALGAVLAATIAYRLILERARIVWGRELIPTLAFVSVILVGMLYTPAYSYGTEKALRFVSLTMLAFFTPLVVIKSYRSVWLFFLGWIGLSMIITVESLGRLGSGGTLSAFSATTIATSRTLGVAVIILIFIVLMGKSFSLWQIAAMAALAPMGLAMAGTGSRGPLLMLAGTVALTMVAVMLKPGRRMRALLLIAALGVVAVGAILSGLIPVAALDRFESLWNGANADTSARSRLLVMDVAWRLFMTHPIFGRGVGSVSAFGVGRDLIYPHNILLELGAETGLVGLGLFLSLMSMVLWRLLTRLHHETNQEAIWPILFATLLFTLSNAMVSGDLNDGRDMWMLAGIAIAATELRGETG